MRIEIPIALLLATCCTVFSVEPAPNADTPSVFERNIVLQPLDGSKPVPLETYRGKRLLVVNVASKCGNTPQYEDLQALHKKHGDQVVVLGFPSNDFGRQEPGSPEEIAAFCQANYGVTFPIFAKTPVKKGEGQHPLYQWLTDPAANGWNDKAPTWNFSKYVIDEDGRLKKVLGPRVKPMSDEVVTALVD